MDSTRESKGGQALVSLIPWVGKTMKKPLLLRDRIIYARLSPLRNPISVMELSRKLGGLVDRNSLARRLKRLEAKGFVQKCGMRWLAVPMLDSADNPHRDLFNWIPQRSEDAWHRRWQYWKLPFPASAPWKKRPNALECWCVYWAGRLMQSKGFITVKGISRFLRITRLSVSRSLALLGMDGLYDATQQKPFLANTIPLATEVEPEKRECAGRTDLVVDGLEMMVKRLANATEIRDVINRRLATGSTTRDEIYTDVRKALMTHVKNGYPGDGGKLVVDWMEKPFVVRQALEDGNRQRLDDVLQRQTDQKQAIEQLEKEVRVQPKARETLATKILEKVNVAMFFNEGTAARACELVPDGERWPLKKVLDLVRANPSEGKLPTVKLVDVPIVAAPAKPSRSVAFADDPEQAGIEEWAAALPDDFGDDDDFGHQSK